MFVLTGEFIVNSTVRGYVDVIFTSIKDNNSIIFATSEDIGVIVKEYLEPEVRKGTPMTFVEVAGDKGSGYIVKITTKGTCKFRYGIRQEARVDQKPI